MRTKVRRSVRSMRLTALSLWFHASLTGVRHAVPKCKCSKMYMYMRDASLSAYARGRPMAEREWVKQRNSPNQSNKIAGDGWLQDANCSSGVACADFHRPERRNAA